MTTTTAVSRGEKPPEPRLYDFAEGFGSVYGRYVRKHLCERLIAEHHIRTVLEAPCNAESYFASPGTQSVIFAEKGCEVVLLHPEEEVVQKTQAFWTALGLPETQVLHHKDLYHLPFADSQFDLVWNFDYIPLFDDPVRFIGEMARVSKNLVMIIVPNSKNIGYPMHAILNVIKRRTSPWGSRDWMSVRPVRRALRALGLEIAESGLIDMPPWPGFDALSHLGKLVRRGTVEGMANHRSDHEVEEFLERLTFVEYAPLPNILKVPFSHQLYLIAQKPEA